MAPQTRPDRAARPLRPWVPKYDARVASVPTGVVGAVWRFFARTAWTREHAGTAGLRGAFWRAMRVVYLAASGFVRDQCAFRAAALTYSTVLSLVPMLALSFAVAKGFGFYDSLRHDTIEPFLDRTFGALPPTIAGAPVDAAAPINYVEAVPIDEQSQAIRVALQQVLAFVDRTDMSALGWFGLVLLVFTAIKLLSTIESTFNEIWGVQRARTWLRKLTDYLAILVVTPLFLFTATGITAAARTSGIYVWLQKEGHLGWLLDALLLSLPILALWLGFTFVYLALPNARTRLKSALIGALVGGTLWQLVLLVHLEFQIGIARYNALYSGFAALPVFLMWIQFSWVAVLLGAEVCNAHQSEPSCSFPNDAHEDEHAFREELALRCLGRIGAAFLSGGAPWSAERLAQDLALPLRPVTELCEVLVERGILASSTHGGERTYLPARALEHVTVKSVLDALRGKSGFEGLPSKSAVDESVEKILAGLDRDACDSRHNRTIQSIAEAVLRTREEPRLERGGASEGAIAPSRV